MRKRINIFETHKNSQGGYECHAVRGAEIEQNYSGHQSDGTHGVPSDWAAQTHEIFQQSLQSNYNGGHTEYMSQVYEQFELMRQMLQRQMAQATTHGESTRE